MLELRYYLARVGRSPFDKRGTGLSYRHVGVAHLEERMDDVRAVMDAVGSERAALFGISEGGGMSMLFAATYPERTRALTLCGSTRPPSDADARGSATSHRTNRGDVGHPRISYAVHDAGPTQPTKMRANARRVGNGKAPAPPRWSPAFG